MINHFGRSTRDCWIVHLFTAKFAKTCLFRLVRILNSNRARKFSASVFGYYPVKTDDKNSRSRLLDQVFTLRACEGFPVAHPVSDCLRIWLPLTGSVDASCLLGSIMSTLFILMTLILFSIILIKLNLNVFPQKPINNELQDLNMSFTKSFLFLLNLVKCGRRKERKCFFVRNISLMSNLLSICFS